MIAIHVSVVAAFFDSGRRNAGTPLEIASTPVSATAPDEKPRSRMNKLSDPPDSFTSGQRLVPVERDRLDAAEPTEPRLRQPEEHHRGDDDDVGVRREREQAARLLDPAQVRERDEQDDHEADRDAMLREPVELRNRDDGGDAGRDRHRDGEDVVDEQRRARDQRRVLAEVLAADDVGTATARVGEDRLPVRRRDEREQDATAIAIGTSFDEPEREARRHRPR